MRKVLLATLLAAIGFAAVLAIPTYLLLGAAPQEDRGGFTCQRSALSQALHPDPDWHTRDFDIPAACNRIAHDHLRDVIVMDGAALVLVLSIPVVGRLHIRLRRRKTITVDYSTWRMPAHRA
jgi:hypothetical protein